MTLAYYVYMILCDDGSFYTGYTKDLDLRMRLHISGKGARYTRMHRPKRLAYVEKLSSRVEAVRRERRIKMMNHLEKAELTNLGQSR